MDKVKSTHKAEVVEITKLEPHPGAENLSIVKVWGYNIVIRTDEWKNKTKGIYIVPDSLVPRRPEFEFLFDGKRSLYNLLSSGMATKVIDGKYARITVVRLRGVLSQGLLIPCSEDQNFDVGDDAADYLGIVRYEPEMIYNTLGQCEPAPPGGFIPVYDVEAAQKYLHCFKEDELVSVSEKIHGANGKWVFRSGRMYAGSRKLWKKYNPENLWWLALKSHPEIEEFCKSHPEIVVYGEAYGTIQKGFSYGLPKGKIKIAVFDLLRDGNWIDIKEARETGGDLPWVPLLASNYPFNFKDLVKFSNGPSLMNGAENIREGIVIKPLIERTHPDLGRVQVKLVSSDYLEGKKSKKEKKKKNKQEKNKNNVRNNHKN